MLALCPLVDLTSMIVSMRRIVPLIIENIFHLFIIIIVWFVILIAAIALSVFIILAILVFTGVLPNVSTVFYVPRLYVLCALVIYFMRINRPKYTIACCEGGESEIWGLPLSSVSA